MSEALVNSPTETAVVATPRPPKAAKPTPDPKPVKAAAPKAVKPAAKPEKAAKAANPSKAVIKPAKAAAAPAKAVKATPVEAKPRKSTGQHGLERDADLPWNSSKVAVWKALQKVGALTQTTAATTNELVENSKLRSETIRHYCYHMKAGGLTGVAQVEGKRGYCFYLTAKGAKVDIKKVEAELGA